MKRQGRSGRAASLAPWVRIYGRVEFAEPVHRGAQEVHLQVDRPARPADDEVMFQPLPIHGGRRRVRARR